MDIKCQEVGSDTYPTPSRRPHSLYEESYTGAGADKQSVINVSCSLSDKIGRHC